MLLKKEEKKEGKKEEKKEEKYDSLYLNEHRYEYIEPMPEQEYDDIVDDSDFKPSAERIRDNDFRGTATAADSGLYDYQANQPIKEKVSDVELLLRNGKLDKADVQKLQEALDSSLIEQNKSKREADVLAAADKAAKSRNAALDEMLGVSTQDKGKSSS